MSGGPGCRTTSSSISSRQTEVGSACRRTIFQPGEDHGEAIADAVRVVRESGLPHRTDSMFTTIEGEWDECMDVVRRALAPSLSSIADCIALNG